MAIIACSIAGCDKLTGMKGTARGWCSKHYNRWKRNGDPLIKTLRQVTLTCTVDGCVKPHDAKGLCTAHITNLRRHGAPTRRRQQGEILDGKKICAGCQLDLSLGEFHLRLEARASRCKKCRAVYSKAHRESRIDITRQQARESAARRPHQRRDAARKRRAAIRSVHVEDVSSIEVHDRDGWICGICQQAIPRVTVWPHPLSPSLDHVIPVSLGGQHSYSNTQASHLVCNMSKGARAA